MYTRARFSARLLGLLHFADKSPIDEHTNLAAEPTALDSSVNCFKPLCAQTPVMSGPPTSPFTKLPLELRQLVYHHVIVDNSNEKVIKVAVNDTQFISDSLKNVAGAILVNKSMSHEVLEYTFSRFGFSLSDLDPSSYSILQKFCDRIGKKNIALIKEIIIPHILAHDVDAYRWVNCGAALQRRLDWCNDIYIYNRIFELQNKRLLNQLPSLKAVKIGFDMVSVNNVLVLLQDKKVSPGMFASLFTLFGSGHRFEVYPGLLWMLAEFHARDISLGLYWTDIALHLHIWKNGDIVPMTKEDIAFRKRCIIDVLSALPPFVPYWKTCPVSDLGPLPGDLFAYGIADDYLKSMRPRSFKD
ncbi:hypothetical protein PMIN02_009897 [Paraphaeosphaeria minitans]